jgi:nucleoid DNA-binding protein
MATTIRETKLFTLDANDIGKSPKMVSNYLDAIIDRLAKEIIRGNSVSIKNLGFFRPRIKGGKEQNYFGEPRYIEPRLVMNYEMSSIMFEKLNDRLLEEDSKKRLNKDCPNEDEQKMIGQKRDKRNLEEMFEVIKQEIRDKRGVEEENYDEDECD